MRFKEKVKEDDNRRRAFIYLTETKGLEPHIAAGIIGNFMQESGHSLNIEAYNPDDLGKPTFGLAQWRGDRLARLKKVAGDKASTLEGQLDFMMWELNNTEKRAFSKLQEANTVEEAAVLFSKFYERPHKDYAHNDKRANYAKNIYSTFVGEPEEYDYYNDPKKLYVEGNKKENKSEDVEAIEQPNYTVPTFDTAIGVEIPYVQDTEETTPEVEEAKEKINNRQNQLATLQKLMQMNSVQYIDPNQKEEVAYLQKGGDTKNKPNLIEREKEWVKEWIEHPEFQRRLSENLKTANENRHPLVRDYFPLDNEDAFFEKRASRIQTQGLEHLDNTETFIGRYRDNEEVRKEFLDQDVNILHRNRNIYGGLQTAVRVPIINKQFGSTIFVNNDGSSSPEELRNIAVHEYTHATNIDSEIIGAINKPKKSNLELPEEYRNYIEGTTEVYPRIMSIRYRGDIKPTEKVTPSKLSEIKRKMPNEDLFNVYSDKEILTMLNTLASNEDNTRKAPVAKRGRKIKK